VLYLSHRIGLISDSHGKLSHRIGLISDSHGKLFRL